MIKDTIFKFFEEEPNLSCAVQAMHISQNRKTGYSQLYPTEVQGLWIAAYFGLANIAKLLLEKGADPTAKTSYGENALHIASRNGHEQVVQLILLAEDKIDVNTKNSRGETELHVAAAGGHVKVVRLLLENGADIEAKTGRGCTALYLAAEAGKTTVVDVLLEKHADFLAEDWKGTTALDQATWRGHEEIVQKLLLLRVGQPISTRQWSRFNWTLEKQLANAAMRGNKADVVNVEALLKKIATANAMNYQGLVALSDGALDHGIGCAAEMGRVELVKLYLKYGVEIDVFTSVGQTPLHRAAKMGHKKVVELLLKRGANLNLKDKIFPKDALEFLQLPESTKRWCRFS